MVLVQIGLVHQLGVAVFLGDIIARIAKGIVGIMPRSVQHERYAGTRPALQHERVFPLGLVSVRVDIHPVSAHVVIGGMAAHAA